MASALPAVGPGENPFLVYSAAVEDLLYPTPTPGFQGRVIVLWVLIGLALVMALLHLGLILFEGYQKKINVIWLFRLVGRSEGRYIITNAKLASNILSIINLVAFIFYNIDACNVFLRHAPEVHSYFWWACSTFGMLFQGWLMSWGLLQAHILTQERYQHKILGPFCINLLFLIGGVVLGSAVIATGLWNAFGGRDLWDAYVPVQASLAASAKKWTGTTDYGAILSLTVVISNLMESAAHYKTTRMVEFGLAAAVALIISFVNIGSLFLSRLLHQQIQFKTEQLRVAKGEVRGASKVSRMSIGVTSDATTTHEESSESRKRLTKSASGFADQQKQLATLRKVQRDLIFTSSALAIVAAAGSAICLSIAIQTRNIAQWPWYALEWAIIGVQWLYCPIILVLFTLLDWNILRTYWIRRRENKADPVDFPDEPIRITVMNRLSSTEVDGYAEEKEEDLSRD
ncbi:hypothetical protein RQP46_008658 [Phenoliferia psychrophenolica]